MSAEKISKLPSEKIRQKSAEEYGRQIGRITTKLMERAAKLDPSLNDGKLLVRQFDTNSYGSLGAKEALHIETGDESVQITRDRVRGIPETGQHDFEVTPGELTGRVQMYQFAGSGYRSRQTAGNYVDLSFGAPELRSGYLGGMDNPVSSSAHTLSKARGHVANAEARQKAHPTGVERTAEPA